MNIQLSNTQKLLLTLAGFGIATIGFMVKLPSVFRYHDKEMHGLFYFVAAGFLNVLFAKNNLVRHFLIFVLLLLFGVCIEYAQAYSNKFFHMRIHGRFDIEDVEYNVKGLIGFTGVWIAYILLTIGSKKNERKLIKENGLPVKYPTTLTLNNSLDLIGDIHGHADELEALLQKLGYNNSEGAYNHPERKVLFIGDYIDRGPKIRETLHMVKSMVDSGNAVALMGNHEYNALCFQMKNTEGGHIRSHSIKNIIQHYETLKQFHNNQDEYEMYLEWFKTLPLYYETSEIRAVHACWDEKNIQLLRNKLKDDLLTDKLLTQSSITGTPFHQAIEQTLKGKEIQLPDGIIFKDKDGTERSEIRIKWWEDARQMTYKSYSVEQIGNLPGLQVNANDLKSPEYYSPEKKIVFFGHYWLKGTPSLYKANVCCLDYSVAKGGKLVAYRFDGEEILDVSKLISV